MNYIEVDGIQLKFFSQHGNGQFSQRFAEDCHEQKTTIVNLTLPVGKEMSSQERVSVYLKNTTNRLYALWFDINQPLLSQTFDINEKMFKQRPPLILDQFATIHLTNFPSSEGHQQRELILTTCDSTSADPSLNIYIFEIYKKESFHENEKQINCKFYLANTFHQSNLGEYTFSVKNDDVNGAWNHFPGTSENIIKYSYIIKRTHNITNTSGNFACSPIKLDFGSKEMKFNPEPVEYRISTEEYLKSSFVRTVHVSIITAEEAEKKGSIHTT